MMATTQSNLAEAGAKAGNVLFKAAFDGTPEKPLEIMAYAFDHQGHLVASAPLKDGQASLPVSADALRGTRLFFAPAPPKARDTKVTLASLARLKPYEPVWKFDPKAQSYELLPIPDFLWKWWYWCQCRVRGQVVKSVVIGGVTYDKPVCGARVHICEVDQLWWIIPRLPDPIIWRLRDELLAALERPVPIPIPDPPPFKFDPGVIDPSPEAIARMNQAQPAQFPLGKFDAARVALNPQPLPPGAAVSLNPQPLPPKVEIAALALETRNALLSNAMPVVRQALLDNVALLHPWLCYWDWFWPYICTCDEEAVLTTDSQGHFDTTLWYQCFGDHPDLYFWVEYSIGGVWTTVYHPYPICCNTTWNYACGSEVTLRVTDPRVAWCGDGETLPGKQVAILSIGNDISMTEIQRSTVGAGEGLTLTNFMPGTFAPPTGDGTTVLDTPFGGSMEPHVFFGDGLIAASITHYRWSYRPLGSLGAWTAVDTPVVRHYAEEKSDGTLTFKPFPLGPDPAIPGQNLFKIRPNDPPAPGGVVVSTSWAPEVDARQNTASAFFYSHLLNGGDALAAAGKYELKLELFKNVGGTLHVVNLTDEGVMLKVPTVDAPFGASTVPTQDVAHFPALVGDQEDRVIRDLGTGKIIAFRLVVHVDNTPSYAEIEEVSVNGALAGDCGFLSYTPGADAVVGFIARHPHNFATFSFGVYKGSCGGVTESTALGWVGRPAVNGFVQGLGGLFTKAVPVVALLNGGSCGTVCLKAAFSENLYVAALATDGWSRLSYLDWGATPKAFALEPAS
jgi:hypothetical protein